MPARVTVYCRKSVRSVTAPALESELARADWYTLAECYDIEAEEIVDRALAYFHIEGEDGCFTLYCRPPGLRQLELSIVDRAETQTAIEEEIAQLGARLAIVARYLQESIEVVTIETGYFQFVEMMPVFADEVARWFARIGDGCVLADDGEWWMIEDDGSFKQLASQYLG
jgi:hypothetical protein